MSYISFNAIDTGDRILIQRNIPDFLPTKELKPKKNEEEGSPKPALSTYPDEVDMGYDHAPWGPGDDFPNRVRNKLAKVALGRQTILRLAQLLYGNGIIYVKRSDLAKTSRPERFFHPDVEDFLDENEINLQWFFPQCLEWQQFWNTFSEMKLSLSRKFIVGLYHKEADFCRLSIQDKKTGIIKYLLYDTRFAFGLAENRMNDKAGSDEKRTIIPLLPWWGRREFFENLRGYTFAWHTKIRQSGTVYYSSPPWEGLFRTNGWVDVAADVPRIVNAMQKNQINLKYQILVEESYFKILYPDWDTFTYEQRNRAIDKFEDAVNEKLVGVDKGYASILSVFKFDELQGREIGKVEIVAIDDKIKNTAWVPGSERANFEIVQGLGGHPTEFGLARENGAMGAGSGSDKREVYNTAITLNTIMQEYLLAPLNFIARFNGWDVKFMIDHTSHTTSNLVESGLVPSQNTILPTDAS